MRYQPTLFMRQDMNDQKIKELEQELTTLISLRTNGFHTTQLSPVAMLNAFVVLVDEYSRNESQLLQHAEYVKSLFDNYLSGNDIFCDLIVYAIEEQDMSFTYCIFVSIKSLFEAVEQPITVVYNSNDQKAILDDRSRDLLNSIPEHTLDSMIRETKCEISLGSLLKV
jgi:hypothetical protein